MTPNRTDAAARSTACERRFTRAGLTRAAVGVANVLKGLGTLSREGSKRLHKGSRRLFEASKRLLKAPIDPFGSPRGSIGGPDNLDHLFSFS
jgi:hypothetical protein